MDDLAREGVFDTLMIPCCKDQIILNLSKSFSVVEWFGFKCRLCTIIHLYEL